MEIKITPFDKRKAYLTEIFGDDKSGAVHRLTPVLPDGSPDPIRTVLYKAVTALQFAGGNTLNINIVIPGVKTLEEAFDAFEPTVLAQVKQTLQAMQDEARRQALLAGIPAPANGAIPGRMNRR